MTVHRKIISGLLQYAAIASLLVVPVSGTIGAQTDEYTSVTGRVIDHETRAPIFNVNILVAETLTGTVTDQNGYFTLENVPVGTHTIQFSHINYIPYSHTQFFIPESTDTLYIEMVSRPIELEHVEVVDTIPGRFTPGRPTGYHYTREDIEATAANTFGQLIRSLVPRSRVREDGGDLYIQLQLRTTIAQRYERARPPYPLIILNGMQLGTSPIGLAAVAAPEQIEYFEVIRPPDAENLYGPEATHGAIIIETRDRTGEEELLKPWQRRVIIGGLLGFILSLTFLI